MVFYYELVRVVEDLIWDSNEYIDHRKCFFSWCFRACESVFLCGLQKVESSCRTLGCTEDEANGQMDVWGVEWKTRVMKICS